MQPDLAPPHTCRAKLAQPGVQTVYAELNGAALAVARGEEHGLRRLRLPVAPPDKPWRGENTIYVPAAKL